MRLMLSLFILLTAALPAAAAGNDAAPFGSYFAPVTAAGQAPGAAAFTDAPPERLARHGITVAPADDNMLAAAEALSAIAPAAGDAAPADIPPADISASDTPLSDSLPDHLIGP